MTDEKENKESQLLKVLREGVSVIQMVLFKQIRFELSERYPDQDDGFVSMLAGALIGEIFNSPNPEQRFVGFRNANKGIIEQELLGMKERHTALLPALTDALRIQVLCDNQENLEEHALLTKANALGLLVVDRPVPMPSSFITLVRGLGEQYGLIIAPIQTTPDGEESTIH